MQALAGENRIAAYSFPGGVVSTLLREIGAGRPGVVTHVGLGTFADPRLDGARCNEAATEELVELIELDGREYLRYKPIHIDVAIIRGSAADPRGNITLRHEPTDLDIVVEGEDCPVLDGTMGPWLRALEAAGVQEGPTTEPWAPEEPCFASTEEGFAAIEACDSPEVAVRHHTPLGRVDEGLVPLEPGPVGALLGDSRRVVMDLEACRARGEWLGLSGKFAASSEQELRTPDEAARFMVVMAVAALSALGPCRVRVLLEGASVQALVAALGAVSNRHT